MKNKFILSLVWASEDKKFHTEWNNDDSIIIWHSKSKDFSYLVELNSNKSLQEACNIIQCWMNGVFKPVDELKYGC